MVEVFCTKSSTCVWKRLIVKEFNSYSSIIHRSKRDTSFVKLLFLNENYRNTAASRPIFPLRARNLLSSPIIETYFHPSIWSFSRPNVSGRDPLIRNWNEFINLRGFIVFECAPPIPEAIKRSIAVKRLPEMCVVTENEARHWSVKSPDSVNVSIFRTTCFFDRLVSMCSAIECWFNAFFFFLSFLFYPRWHLRWHSLLEARGNIQGWKNVHGWKCYSIWGENFEFGIFQQSQFRINKRERWDLIQF